jgi:hypothetical protein
MSEGLKIQAHFDGSAEAGRCVAAAKPKRSAKKVRNPRFGPMTLSRWRVRGAIFFENLNQGRKPDSDNPQK